MDSEEGRNNILEILNHFFLIQSLFIDFYTVHDLHENFN